MRGVSETLVQATRIIPNHFISNGRQHKCSKVVAAAAQNRAQLPDSQDSNPLQATRRVAALSFAIITLSGQLDASRLLAEEEKPRFWLDGPLDTLPPVSSKIYNEETGTRSFLKQGVYMAKTGPKGSAYRLKKTAFDLLGMADVIEQNAWAYIRRFLRLKSTFMYYDFEKVIAAAPEDQKNGLTDLANRLFDNVEKLEVAVKLRSVPQTISYYKETSNILEEVMTRMAPETLKRDLVLLER